MLTHKDDVPSDSFYLFNAPQLCNLYRQKTLEQVHVDVMSYIKKAIETYNRPHVLDVGSGSGRDSYGINALGCSVTAIEPCIDMLQNAQLTYADANIHWIHDKFPQAKMSVEPCHLILMSAVWMHIHPSFRELAAQQISELLIDSGIVAIYIRNGEFCDGRTNYTQDKHALISLMNKYSMFLDFSTDQSDTYKRPGVSWDLFIFKKTGVNSKNGS